MAVELGLVRLVYDFWPLGVLFWVVSSTCTKFDQSQFDQSASSLRDIIIRGLQKKEKVEITDLSVHYSH